MTFDNILGILAVIFFVVVPLITSVTKGREKRGDQPNQPGGRNWQGGQTTSQEQDPAGAGRPQQSQSGQPQVQQSRPAAEDSLEARLREARRRIEEALSDPQAQTGSGTQARPAQQQPAARGGTVASPLSQAGADRRPAPTPPRPTPQPRPAPVRKRRPQGRSADMGVSEDLQITRLSKPSPYTRGRTSRRSDSGGLNSASGVINGIIWHQILSEPPSKRFFRRRTSRLRSP